MGAVYLGHDKLLDRPVAIKFLSSVVHDRKLRERYLVEARTAARLQHSNVVTIHRVGEIDSRLYIVTEYVRGQTLEPLAADAPSRRAGDGVGLARAGRSARRRGAASRHQAGQRHPGRHRRDRCSTSGSPSFWRTASPSRRRRWPQWFRNSSDARAPTIDFFGPAGDRIGSAATQHSGRAVVRPGLPVPARRSGGEVPRHDGRSSGGYRRLVAASSIKGHADVHGARGAKRDSKRLGVPIFIRWAPCCSS